jgi:uncharacterized membrane protein YjjB (DUF3815 family)
VASQQPFIRYVLAAGIAALGVGLLEQTVPSAAPWAALATLLGVGVLLHTATGQNALAELAQILTLAQQALPGANPLRGPAPAAPPFGAH